MFRQDTRSVFFLFLFAFVFSSCGTSRILGLQRQEAADLLYRGDLGFIVRSDLPEDFPGAVSRLTELSRVHPAAAFYAGLLAGSSAANRNLQIPLFSAALQSPSLPARREAAARLMSLILETAETHEIEEFLQFLSSANARGMTDTALLRAAALYRLGRYAEAASVLPADLQGWERALAFFAAWNIAEGEVSEAQRREITAFLFDLPAGNLRRWAYSEALSLEGLLAPEEHGLIFSRRFPISHSITLNNLRPALEDGGLLFFRHPALIGDLARAFQFTPAMRAEGIELFTAWDSLLESGVLPSSLLGRDFGELESFAGTLDRDEVNARRYLILHHAGRIERARGRFPQSTEKFWRALALAPDTLQSDACIWYILMNTVAHNPPAAAELFLQTIPYWTDMFVFNGVLDRLSQYLTSQRQWDTLLEVFHALESRAAAGVRPAGSLGQFAWIAGRAVQEGFLTADRSAESFFRLAFEQPTGTFYYRTLAALQLGENFSPSGNERRARRASAAPVQEGGELEFLLGFFQHGATAFALPFIRAQESGLSIPELRRLAAAMAGAEQWQESIRLVARYMNREDFQISREDLYLSHPQPFRELIEAYAGDMGLRPETMFALIRTESHFGAAAVSHAGAVGLAQLMPSTAQDVAARIVRAGGTDHRSPNGINLTDPRINIHMGSFYMRHLIVNQMEGNVMLALMAYNGGQGRVRRWLAADRQREDGGLPKDLFLETILYPETRHYGRLVLSAAAIYGYLYYGLTMEEVAVNIFGSGR